MRYQFELPQAAHAQLTLYAAQRTQNNIADAICHAMQILGRIDAVMQKAEGPGPRLRYVPGFASQQTLIPWLRRSRDFMGLRLDLRKLGEHISGDTQAVSVRVIEKAHDAFQAFMLANGLTEQRAIIAAIFLLVAGSKGDLVVDNGGGRLSIVDF